MNRIIIFFTGILVLSFSCQKSILDKQPLNMVSDDVVWTSIQGIQSVLAGCYSDMSVFENETPDKYVSISSGQWTTEAQAGVTLINNITDEGAWGMYSNWSNYRYTGITITGGLLEWWENSYIIIRRLNEFIAKVPGSPISADSVKTYVAEARFLRAFNYFSMVKRYGGVPIITTPQSLTDPKDSLYPKRNSEQEVYDFVINEMNAVYNDLPVVAQPGRASKYAALALLSRAALYAGSIAENGTVQLNGLLGIPASQAQAYYQKSYDASQTIINDGVCGLYNQDADKVTNFKNIFLVKNNKEAIFVVEHNSTDMIASGGNGWYYDFMQGPMPNAWYNGNQNEPYLSFIGSTFEKTDGTAPDLSTATLEGKLWDDNLLWAGMEPRFFATIYTNGTEWQGSNIDWHTALYVNGQYLTDPNGAYNGVPDLGLQAKKSGPYTGFGVMKYLDESHNNMVYGFTSSQDWIVFRYAEVLLNDAEAAFKLGKTSEALNDVNQIRARAGVAPRTAITFPLIQKERKVELAFEGERYWDLRRWRTATTVLTERETGLRYVRDYASGKLKLQVLEDADGGVNMQPTFYSYNYYLPITTARTQQNPNLVENPGYK